VDHHISDTEKHIDPRRDSERWAELTKRMDKMDKKLDNILTLERDNNFKRKGDSEDA
jgi:tetrahydromethanopterin S-methyltransferase subunit G